MSLHRSLPLLATPGDDAAGCSRCIRLWRQQAGCNSTGIWRGLHELHALHFTSPQGKQMSVERFVSGAV